MNFDDPKFISEVLDIVSKYTCPKGKALIDRIRAIDRRRKDFPRYKENVIFSVSIEEFPDLSLVISLGRERHIERLRWEELKDIRNRYVELLAR